VSVHPLPGPAVRTPELSGAHIPWSPAGVTDSSPATAPGRLLTRRRHVDLLLLAGYTCR